MLAGALRWVITAHKKAPVDDQPRLFESWLARIASEKMLKLSIYIYAANVTLEFGAIYERTHEHRNHGQQFKLLFRLERSIVCSVVRVHFYTRQFRLEK